MSSEQQIELSAAVQMLLACKPSEIDETAIRQAIGDKKAKSAAEVARIFGVSYVTIKTAWRPNGMPADEKAKSYSIADILIWTLHRNERNETARGANEFTKRRQEADAISAEAEARIKMRKAELAEGEFVPLVSVKSVLKGMLNVFRDTMCSIPRQLTPMFPKRYATEWTEEADRLIRNGLTIIAEKPIDDFLERMNDAEEND